MSTPDSILDEEEQLSVESNERDDGVETAAVLGGDFLSLSSAAWRKRLCQQPGINQPRYK